MPRNYIKLFIVLLLMPIFLSACAQFDNPGNDEIGAGSQAVGILKVTVLDIGKADAIILTTENHTVIIDAGLEKSNTIILDFLSEQGINSIDYMILTHFDKDHIGSADSVIETVEVKQIIQPTYTESSKQYEQYAAALDAAGIKPVSLKKELRFTLDTVEFIIYSPEKDTYELVNDYSLVMSVQHGDNRLLFTGDAMTERLKELLQTGNLEHIFLKVPHHGAYDEKSKEFFDAVGAKYAVITCSKKEPASDEVLSLLSEARAEVYNTSEGNVYCESDGSVLSVWQ